MPHDIEKPALYETAVKKGLQFVRKFLASKNDDNHTTLTFESRGKSEDAKLRYFFSSCGEDKFKFVLHTKSAGGLGLQFADMIARPIGVHILNPQQNNRAWEIIQGKLFIAPALLPEEK